MLEIRGQVDTLKRRVEERLVADEMQGLRKTHPSQVVAAAKGRIANLGESLGERHLSQTWHVRERAPADNLATGSNDVLREFGLHRAHEHLRPIRVQHTMLVKSERPAILDDAAYARACYAVAGQLPHARGHM